jgi:hypothetical protein
VGVPRNTPTDVVDRLSREINAGLADSKIRRSWPTCDDGRRRDRDERARQRSGRTRDWPQVQEPGRAGGKAGGGGGLGQARVNQG